jgi:hypothetical protein
MKYLFNWQVWRENFILRGLTTRANALADTPACRSKGQHRTLRTPKYQQKCGCAPLFLKVDPRNRSAITHCADWLSTQNLKKYSQYRDDSQDGIQANIESHLKKH